MLADVIEEIWLGCTESLVDETLAVACILVTNEAMRAGKFGQDAHQLVFNLEKTIACPLRLTMAQIDWQGISVVWINVCDFKFLFFSSALKLNLGTLGS